MRWSARQRAMLDEMGLRLWSHGRTVHSGEQPSLDPTVVPPNPSSELGAIAEAPDNRGAGGGLASATPARHAALQSSMIPTMGWPALREAVASCTACELCHGRTKTVFGSGNVNARWMIISEAPDDQEDRIGEPFAGKSGQLLDRMLHALKLTRSEGSPTNQVYVTNVVKCRPPASRSSLANEMMQCEPFLIRQIRLVQPAVILAMGRLATQTILRSSEPLGRLRGQVHRFHGVPLVVTYDTAYLLRNPQDKSRVWEDLCLTMDALRRATTQS